MTIELFNNGEFDLQITPVGDSFTVAAPGLARGLAVRDALNLVRAVPDEEKGYSLVSTPGGEQQAWFVREPGFYRVVGQRQVGRIEDSAVRSFVERFQNWVFRDVIPQIRRTGAYALPEADGYEPDTYTWDETAAQLRQRHGYEFSVNELTRRLRTAGVLKQTGAPRAKFADLFWFTGSAWTVHPYAVRRLAQRIAVRDRVLGEQRQFHFIQGRLELEGLGGAQ
jgi:prophage antirepressor-like protein